VFLFNVGCYEIVNLRKGGYHKSYTQETSLNTKGAYSSYAEREEVSTAVIPTFHETLSVASV
jgi:hypothetical protein